LKYTLRKTKRATRESVVHSYKTLSVNSCSQRIHHKMLPASRNIEMRWKMRAAVEMADAVVRVRGGNRFPDGQGLVENLNGLNAWCKVTVLRLVGCQLRRTGAISLAEAIASFLSTSLVELDLRGNDIEEGGGRALAETLRLNTTLTSLNLGYNRLGEIGWRALAETLRLNTTLTSLNLGVNGLGQG
jgi:Ran GTPase-activating protein (RanGAP) involved in mRNA processing and transport